MAIKPVFIFIAEVLQVVIIALAIVLPIRFFIFQPFIVKGASMEPNFHEGDYLIIDEISYRLHEPQRGEVIVFKYPLDTSKRFIKRVVGLPGETVQVDKGRVIINTVAGEKIILDETPYLTIPLNAVNTNLDTAQIQLQQNEYFVLGDNRNYSFDSRSWGALPREYIIGRVVFRAWPPLQMTVLGAPRYSH